MFYFSLATFAHKKARRGPRAEIEQTADKPNLGVGGPEARRVSMSPESR